MSAAIELSVLQAVRLKGRANDATVAHCTDQPADVVQRELARLVTQGFLRGDATYRITPQGRSVLDGLLDRERNGLQELELAECYDAFDEHNNALKTVVTAWQMRDAKTPNDHTDAAYDHAVVAELMRIHQGFASLLRCIVRFAPRLAPYPKRFNHAVQKIVDGDLTFVASPMADSYHTVWFELHEELIGLLGRTRAAEAAAGRAV